MSLEEGPDQSRGILSAETVATENSVSVKTISLAELIEYVQVNLETDQIDLVKMDIEGAEHEFLPGIPAETLQAIQSWQMEYHPNGSKQLLFNGLEKAGFNCIEDKVIGCNCGVAHFKRNTLKDFAMN